MAAAPIQNPKQEFWGVLALALGFGLVGIDRFLISTMFPTIAHDLHLSYGGIGVITGALAIAWGFAALIMGNLSDRIGQRIVLTGALIVFSLLIGTSGLATSLLGLVFVRVLMGFADGAYTPASIAATIAVSPEDRHGRNVGLQQTTLGTSGSETGTRRTRMSGSRLIRSSPTAALLAAVTPTRIIREVTLLIILKIN